MELRVETGIPSGNACDVAVERSPGGWRVAFSPDPHGGPESLWFCFRLAVEGNTDWAADLMPAKIRGTFDRWFGGWRARRERLGAGRRVKHPDGRVDAAWEAGFSPGFPNVALCYPYDPAAGRRSAFPGWALKRPVDRRGIKVLTRERYGKIGARMAGAVAKGLSQ